jgi:cell fate (sporulation/competence/biofilm development) regulator YlbF (YheA/YmcA/DUF963 family)
MDRIVNLAERLGRAIADSPQAGGLREARKALAEESELSQLLKDYQAQSEKVAILEAENKPVEVDDKHRLRDLHEKLVASETFKKLSAAQVEYVDLMRRVSEAMQEHLAETEED